MLFRYRTFKSLEEEAVKKKLGNKRRSTCNRNQTVNFLHQRNGSSLYNGRERRTKTYFFPFRSINRLSKKNTSDIILTIEYIEWTRQSIFEWAFLCLPSRAFQADIERKTEVVGITGRSQPKEDRARERHKNSFERRQK